MLTHLLSNYFILTSMFTSLFIAQGSKTMLFLIRRNVQVTLKTLLTSGGMPSTHSAIVASLTTAIGIEYGVSSAIFAVAATFSGIVVYDATGIRQAVGKQAVVVNKLSSEAQRSIDDWEFEDLYELLGHTPREAFMGVLTGIFVTFVLEFVANYV